MNLITADLSKFGYKELKIATKLLLEYTRGAGDFLISNIVLNFNTDSGNVFLSDEDYNVGMLNGISLEQFFTCPECGNEGFKEDFKKSKCKDCQRILNY